MILTDKMRMSESSKNTAQVNLILNQCLQTKEFETV